MTHACRNGMRRGLATLTLMGVAGASVPAAWAAPGVSLDARQGGGSDGRVVRSATAVGVLPGPFGNLTVALSRVDDSLTGPATVVGFGEGIGLGSLVSFKAGVARAQWERAPDAWIVSAGPEAHFLGNALAARVEHTSYGDGRTAHGVAFDLEHGIGPRWAARLDASYAHGSDGTLARAFLGGARFRAFGPLQVVGEAGVARDPNGVLAAGRGGEPGSPGLLGGLPPAPAPGNPAASLSSSALHPTLLLGVRCALP